MEHGFVDFIVPRTEMKKKLSLLLGMLAGKKVEREGGEVEFAVSIINQSLVYHVE